MSADLLYEYFYPPTDYFKDSFEEDVPSPDSLSLDVGDSSPQYDSYFQPSFDIDFCIWNENSLSPEPQSEQLPQTVQKKTRTTSTPHVMPSPPTTNSPSCHVCASPTANTLHFGGRSCKACAAFFRRSVAMTMTYECIGTGNDEIPCKIHYELRMLCRHCRFIKCLEAGMRRELVQAKKEETKVAKRRSKGLVTSKNDNVENSYDDYVNAYTNFHESSPKQECEPMEMTIPESYLSPDVSSCSQPLDMTAPVSLSPPPPMPLTPSVLLTPSTIQTSIHRGVSHSPPFDPQQASTSQAGGVIAQIQYYRIVEYDQKIFDLIDHYVRAEASLNDRRKIMYTDTQIRDVFDTTCECPYELHQLKPFDYKTFCGFVKHDFVMILDYVNQFTEFQGLAKNDKNVVYRMACAVDSMLASAYYSYRIGIENERLVLFNGDFIDMNPAPISGEEPNSEKNFETPQDHEKYKTLMPLKLKQYFDLAVPFSRLGVSFEEYVLLKALIIWQISNYRLDDVGRVISARQRDAILQALHKVVEESGDEFPAIRVGQLLLSMSYITEQVQAMTSSYLVMTFFDVVSCDSIMYDLLSFKDD
uniref:Nuclear receptor n=1 Tax=Caenorhabditis tropicalis TaxID=1561998 RepID=A0A1I7TTC0_9PELO